MASGFQGKRATARIEPIRVKRYNGDLHVDEISVVGYRARCRCKWSSTSQPTWTAARAALSNHREREHAGASHSVAVRA